MLFRELCRDPDNRYRLQARCVRQQLTEMSMVCPLELVFDEHPVASFDVLAQDIRSKWANVPFLSL